MKKAIKKVFLFYLILFLIIIFHLLKFSLITSKKLMNNDFNPRKKFLSETYLKPKKN